MSNTASKPVLWVVLLVVAVVVALAIVYLGPKFLGGYDAIAVRADPNSSVDITAADLQESVQTVTLSGAVSPQMFDEIKDSLIGSFCQLNREVWNNQYVAARYLHTDDEGNAYSRVIPASDCPPPQEGERPIIPSADDMPVVPPQADDDVVEIDIEEEVVPVDEGDVSSEDIVIEEEAAPALAEEIPAE